MRFIKIIILLSSISFAKVYMAKVEPINSFDIYSKVAGEVIYVNKKNQNKIVNETIVKIDSSLEDKKLKAYTKKLEILEKELAIKASYYKKILNLRSETNFEKDKKLIEIYQLEVKILDLKKDIALLKDEISYKTIHAKNLYLKKFYINTYDYINKGTKVAKLYDISSAKLTIYIDKEEFDNILNKKIYINGKENKGGILRLDITTDEVYLSSYKLEIKADIKAFGKIVKVEIK